MILLLIGQSQYQVSGSTDTKAIIISQVWCRAARISQISKSNIGVPLGIWFITVTIFQVSEANTKAISDIGFIFVISIRHLVHVAVQTNWPHITDIRCASASNPNWYSLSWLG